MDASGGQGLYPLHRCKTLHFVRHAQGFHNVAGEKDHQAYSSYDYLDATLTPLGWDQVDNLRNHVQATGLSNKIDLVIVSPLTRTLQTAVGVFGGGEYSDGIDVLPLMVADGGNSGRPAISSFNCSPFLAVELCRELLIESDEDILWMENKRETAEEVAERGMKFIKWLWSRREKEIAIVTHSGFLFHTLSAFGNDCHQIVKNDICTHFKNCELRSMLLVDKSRASCDIPTTNFTGKVPDGPDLPSDAVDENLS
ncbi:hypothetical protein KSS87_014680 [Heliosperma pusillum]|nr:hypothetical protein KSS87_014680 [Heliosperma pusillum]